MKCLKCGIEMIVKAEREVTNPDVTPVKTYLRTTYLCEKDDVWITVEVPLETKS